MRRLDGACDCDDAGLSGVVSRWQLELGEPFFAPYSKLVAPARLPDGTDVVLKIAHDLDTESLQEPEALRFWNGEGTVLLLDHDPATRSMLLERCLPGTPLGTEYDQPALEVAAQALERLWRPASDDVPWRRIEDVAPDWQAVDVLRDLLPTQGERVLC